jgi:antitoxin component YwqK of YwqJK toxin-antitoxin module
MKLYTFIPLLFLIASCNGRGQESEVTNQVTQKTIDSCTNALPFENAAAAEAMVEKNYSGVLKNYRGLDTTKLDFVHFFENGKLVSSKFYFENGQVQEEYTFLCSSLHGLQKFYNQNGSLAKVIPYRYGRTNGIGRLYDETGTLRQEVTLVNDSIVLTKDFDASGKLINQ